MTPEQFELLIRISEKQELMYDILSNHLQHHEAYSLVFLATGLTLISAVIVLWLKNRALTRLLPKPE